METREDNFDFAVQCNFWTIRHLKNHMATLDPECADMVACQMALGKAYAMVDILSPSEGDWPEAKDGMGQVIPFIPRQRA
jgi:hypothetical protein